MSHKSFRACIAVCNRRAVKIFLEKASTVARIDKPCTVSIYFIMYLEKETRRSSWCKYAKEKLFENSTVEWHVHQHSLNDVR